jgi:hypothetical protein
MMTHAATAGNAMNVLDREAVAGGTGRILASQVVSLIPVEFRLQDGTIQYTLSKVRQSMK